MRDAVRAEWTKLRTVPSTGWLLIAIIALTVGASAMATAIVKCPATCDADTTKLSLTGILLGQAAVAAIAVVVVTAEYGTGMIRVSLAAVPRRSVLLAAKAVVVTAVVLVAGSISVLGSVLAGRIELPGNGFTAANGFQALSILHGPTLRAAAGSVLYLVLIGLLALGISTALRDAGLTTAVVLGVLYVVPLISVDYHQPGLAASHRSLGADERGPGDPGDQDIAKLPIGPWPGLGVLALWTAAALAAGWLVLRLRDA